MLKNIVLDFGNVIMNYDPDQILDQYDLNTSEHDLLKKEIFQSPEWQEVDAGAIDEDQATAIFLQRVPEELHDQVQEIMTTWPSKVEFFSAMLAYMKQLKAQDYNVYGLSNTGTRFAEYVKQSEWDEVFDGYVFSAEEKLMKPDDRIYQTLLKRYDLKAEESLFVDDLAENIAGAQANGMQGFVFKIDKLDELKSYIEKQGMK